MSSFAYISLLEGGLKLAIAWAISMTTSDKLIMYGLLMLGVSLLTTSLYVGYAMRQFEEARPTLKPDFTQLREMFSFAGWSMVGSIAAAGYNQGLNLVINAFFGTTINAARGIAMHVQTVVRNFSGSFQMSVNPQITKSYAAQDREYFRKLIFKGSLYSSYLFLFFAAPVFWEVDQMLGLWLVEVPPHTAAFVRIMLLISIVEVLASPLNTGIQASGRIKRQEITIGGILLMIVPLSYLALQWVEWPEIVFAIDLGCVIMAHAMRMYNARILCGLSIRGYIRQVLGRLAMVQACASLLPLMLWWQLEGTLINGIIVCVAAVASNLTVIYVLGLELDERATIIRYIENKLHR